MPGPAYRIVTPRLVLRCWDPADANLLQEAVAESVDQLRPWLPWARAEPLSLDARAELLRRFRGGFDLGSDFVYGIFSPDERQVLGGTGLHTRVGDGAREIGYWIRTGHLRAGYATEAAGALTRVAFEVDDVTRVEIRCDPENHASARIPARLGFTRDAVLRRRIAAGGELRDAMIWSIFREEYERSASRAVAVRAFDVLGRPLPMAAAATSGAA